MTHDASFHETRHVPYLDGWRGMAILLVLSAHFGRGVMWPLGRLGVDVFFVLSGLLMSRILFVERMPIGLFYKRRIARIFPVFYLYLFLISVGAWMYVQPFPGQELIYTALFLRTYFPALGIWDSNLPIDHLWSLNIEEHCYVFLSIVGLLALVSHTKEKIARLAVTAAALACIGFFIIYKLHPPVNLPAEARTECSGFSLLVSCSVFLWLRHLKPVVPPWVPVICGLAGIAISAPITHGPLKFIIAPALLAVSVNTLGVAPHWLRHCLSNRILMWFGMCSYSIYLWQQPFCFVTKFHLWRYNDAAGLALALITGVCSFYGFERPMRKWIRDLGNSR